MNIITRLDKIKHRNLMKNILISIYKDFDLWTSLVFKWWTAVYFLYWLDRFSTDLDFDLILENTKLSDEKILDKINKILIKFWEVKKSFNKKNTIFSLLSYWNIDHNIKIEISKRGVSGNYEKTSWFSSSLLVMKKESIFTNKLVALLNRTNLANRDIYDIYFFFENNIDFDIELLEKQVWKNYIEYFKEIIIFLKNIKKSHSILEWLWEVLDEDKKKFVKEKLLREVIWMFEFRVKFD